MNGYNLSRAWFNYRFDNPDKCRPSHTEMYFYIVDLWNRLGQKEKIGLPTGFTMAVLNIGSYNTYKKTLNDLVEFGFITTIQESKNQHHSRIIALVKNDNPTDNTLDKSIAISGANTPIETPDTIDEQLNNKTNKERKANSPASEKKRTSKKPSTINNKKEDPSAPVGPEEKLLRWIDRECPNVQNMDSPITSAEAGRLISDYSGKASLVRDVLLSMDNHRGLKKKYVSANRTLRSWISMREKKNAENENKQNPTTIQSLPSSADKEVKPKFHEAAQQRIKEKQD